jgi:rubrerythrin
MEDRDIQDYDIENLKQTIALERFAISRYNEQLQKIPIVKLKMLIPGVMANEEEHEARVFNLARSYNRSLQVEDIPLFALDKPKEEILAEEGYKSKLGFKSVLQAFYLDLNFEKRAMKLYKKFAE